MPYFIYLTEQAGVGPESIQFCSDDSTLYFKAQGWTKADPAPEFFLVFESAFDGQWNKNRSDKPIGTSGADGRTWKSKKKSGWQRVKIKLKSTVNHPEEGYKYTVKMNGNELDPRVVPR